MNQKNDNKTTTERKSDLELVATRTFDALPHIVFKAWTTPELFIRWWVPKSGGMTLISCEMDVRLGGGYSLEFGHPAFDKPMIFFGKYIEVTPNQRLAWTNEESDEGPLTVVTFEEKDGQTLLTLTETYPTKQALEASLGGIEAAAEQFEQLDAILLGLCVGE
ncbi:MAG: hsp90 [Hyphomonadaceae bacterium]|nr:MAG: hsp90 [Hyphomonadaceae bacterium]KAF0184318.1 MAG: hsp90 [Hyphomonadaceae bacterium]